MLSSKKNGDSTTPVNKTSIELPERERVVSVPEDLPKLTTNLVKENEGIHESNSQPLDTFDTKPDDPDETGRSSSRSLAASLGFASWSHGQDALLEALKVKAEHEKTKQEFFRFESNKVVLEILDFANRLGIPGQSLPLLFSTTDNAAKINLMQTLRAEVSGSSGVPANAPTAPADGGGIPQYHPSKLNTEFSNSHITPSPVIGSSLWGGSLPHAVGNPGPLKSPRSPRRMSSTLNSPISMIPPPHVSTPTSQNSQLMEPRSQPQSRAPFDFKRSERGRSSPERFVPGHRVSVSALPAYGSSVGNSIYPEVLSSPRQVVPAGAFYVQSLNSSNPSRMSQPVQESPNAQHHSAAHFLPPLSEAQREVSGTTQSSSSKLTQDEKRSIPHQPLVPVLNTISSKSSRTRGHDSSVSTGSDLQIHQWKPKQLLRDNRLKISNPFSRKKGRSSDAVDDMSITLETQPTKRTQESPQSPRMAALAAANHSYDQSLPLVTTTSPSRVRGDTLNTAAVVAAQNNRRRRTSTAHSRRWSAASITMDSSLYSDNEDVKRRNEGVAALTSLANNGQPALHDNVESQKQPTLLRYLEGNAEDQNSKTAPPASGTYVRNDDT